MFCRFTFRYMNYWCYNGVLELAVYSLLVIRYYSFHPTSLVWSGWGYSSISWTRFPVSPSRAELIAAKNPQSARPACRKINTARCLFVTRRRPCSIHPLPPTSSFHVLLHVRTQANTCVGRRLSVTAHKRSFNRALYQLIAKFSLEIDLSHDTTTERRRAVV